MTTTFHAHCQTGHELEQFDTPDAHVTHQQKAHRVTFASKKRQGLRDNYGAGATDYLTPARATPLSPLERQWLGAWVTHPDIEGPGHVTGRSPQHPKALWIYTPHTNQFHSLHADQLTPSEPDTGHAKTPDDKPNAGTVIDVEAAPEPANLEETVTAAELVPAVDTPPVASHAIPDNPHLITTLTQTEMDQAIDAAKTWLASTYFRTARLHGALKPLLEKLSRVLPQPRADLAADWNLPDDTVETIQAAVIERCETRLEDMFNHQLKILRGWKPLHPDRPTS